MGFICFFNRKVRDQGEVFHPYPAASLAACPGTWRGYPTSQ
jgi:hypothetical protein